MNETMNALLTRRSVRKYTPEMPKREDLEQIIQAGLYAASGKGGQSSIILAVTDKQLRDRLMEMNRQIGGWAEGFDPFYGAPAVLVVLAKKGTPYTVADGSLSYYAIGMEHPVVAVDGDMAAVTYTSVLSANAYGARGTFRMKGTHYYKRINGEWIAVNRPE